MYGPPPECPRERWMERKLLGRDRPCRDALRVPAALQPGEALGLDLLKCCVSGSHSRPFSGAGFVPGMCKRQHSIVLVLADLTAHLGSSEGQVIVTPFIPLAAWESVGAWLLRTSQFLVLSGLLGPGFMPQGRQHVLGAEGRPAQPRVRVRRGTSV